MPALNEEKGLGGVIKDLPKKIEGIDEIKTLVVDDGSTDRTAEIARENGADVISHGTNKGVGSAFHSAVEYALDNRVDILVSIDADRQFNSKQIPEIIQPILKNKADMVTGDRFHSGMPENMSKTKYWGNKQMSRLISLLSGKKFRDVSCGFRAYGREALLKLNLFGQFTYTQETIMDMVFKGMRVIEFPIDIVYFKERKSRVASSILKYMFRTLKIIVRTVRDYKPMIFFGGMGAAMLLMGVGFEAFLFYHYFTQGSFSPYKSVGFIGLGFLIFGLLLMIVGLLADMFNRVRINQEKIIYELKKGKYEGK